MLPVVPTKFLMVFGVFFVLWVLFPDPSGIPDLIWNLFLSLLKQQ